MVPEVMRASPYMDHRMTLELGLKNQLPNPREAWGQTLQLQQRTQADDPRLRGYTGHRATLDTLCGVVAGAGGSHGTPRTLDTLCGESRRCRRLPSVQWGQTLQLRQRTQVDDPGLRCSHRTPRTLDTLCGESQRPGALNGHSVPNPPRVVS
jgi:hypothetical protein